MIHLMWDFDTSTKLFTCPAEKLKQNGTMGGAVVAKVPEQAKNPANREMGNLCNKLI